MQKNDKQKAATKNNPRMIKCFDSLCLNQVQWLNLTIARRQVEVTSINVRTVKVYIL
jgi:hypothetical protein